MANIPYTTVPGKLEKLLKKIRDTGVPGKANTSWLTSMGMKSSNDRSMLTVLKALDFIDASGVPTENWKKYRGSDYKVILANAIKEGYPDLFSTYPDAFKRDNTELEHFFRSKSTVGQETLSRMVSTFKSLCSLADFSKLKTGLKDVGIRPKEQDIAPSDARGKQGAGVTVNINIQLTLPETTDEKVYESIFEAMKRHIINADAND